MNILTKLPPDISNKFFQYFRHPVSELVQFYYRPPQILNLLKDIRNYHYTLKKIYLLTPNHSGEFGRSTILNHLWKDLAALVCLHFLKHIS